MERPEDWRCGWKAICHDIWLEAGQQILASSPLGPCTGICIHWCNPISSTADREAPSRMSHRWDQETWSMIDQHHLDHCLQETCSYWSSCPLYTHSSRNFPHKTCENISTIKNTIVVWFQTCWPAYKWVALTLLPIGVSFTQFFLVNNAFNVLNWKQYQPRRSTYKILIYKNQSTSWSTISMRFQRKLNNHTSKVNCCVQFQQKQNKCYRNDCGHNQWVSLTTYWTHHMHPQMVMTSCHYFPTDFIP